MSTFGKSSSRLALIVVAVCVAAMDAWAGEWTEPKPSLHRGAITITYRARLAGDWLIVEATHAPHWHTYAMDNLQRAQKATGKEAPETELPTRIDVSGGLKAVGAWKQSAPKDLTKLDIQWYSWGFEGTARFATKVERTGGAEAVITVNAQSCDETSCSMVRELKITLPVPATETDGDSAAMIKDLVDVASSEKAAT